MVFNLTLLKHRFTCNVLFGYETFGDLTFGERTFGEMTFPARLLVIQTFGDNDFW